MVSIISAGSIHAVSQGLPAARQGLQVELGRLRGTLVSSAECHLETGDLVGVSSASSARSFCLTAAAQDPFPSPDCLGWWSVMRTSPSTYWKACRFKPSNAVTGSSSTSTSTALARRKKKL